MKINVRVQGLQEARLFMAGLERKIKTVTVASLNDAAYVGQQAAKKEMQRVFDRPTPWVLNAVVYYKAGVAGRSVRVPGVFDERGRKQSTTLASDKLSSEVRISYDGNKQGVRVESVLAATMEGGRRALKRHEVALQRVGILPRGMAAVPGQGATIDAYGNQSGGQIRQILSWFQANADVGSTSNMTQQTQDRRRKGTKNKAGYEYFVVSPGARRTWQRANGKTGSKKMQPGIYQRFFLGAGSRIIPVIIFVPIPAYNKRFDFYAVVQKAAEKQFVDSFKRYTDQLLKERGL